MSKEPVTFDSLLPKATRYNRLHAKIETAIATMFESKHQLGEFLVEMKDSELYKVHHDTWDDYIKTCHTITRRHADRLVSSERARKMLEISLGAGHNVPKLEGTPAPEPEPSKPPEKKAKAREIKPPVVIDAETGKPEPMTGDEIKTLSEKVTSILTDIDPDLDPTQISYTAAESAPQQIELDFTVQIIAPDDDRLWFQSLTPTERGQAIAKARSAQ